MKTQIKLIDRPKEFDGFWKDLPKTHLTARQKQVIAYALENGITAAKSTKIKCWIDAIRGEFAAITIQYNESNDWGKMLTRTTHHFIKFQLAGA